jgi:hypothetical protein
MIKVNSGVSLSEQRTGKAEFTQGVDNFKPELTGDASMLTLDHKVSQLQKYVFH